MPTELVTRRVQRHEGLLVLVPSAPNSRVPRDLTLSAFVDALCENFTKYQRFSDGQYWIVPTAKQRSFVQRIIKAEECFHFSEVPSSP